MKNIGTDLQRVVKFFVALINLLLAQARSKQFEKVAELLEDANVVVRELELTVASLMPPGGTTPPPKFSFANIGSILKWATKNYGLILFVTTTSGDITADFRQAADDLATKWNIKYK